MAKKTTKKPVKKTKVDVKTLIAAMETDFADLNRKYQHLRGALLKPHFVKTVGEEQYDLLVDQANAMEQYRNILGVRIQLLKNSI
jgi:predicted sulfurtransferase